MGFFHSDGTELAETKHNTSDAKVLPEALTAKPELGE